MNSVKLAFASNGEPVEPGWHLLYTSGEECAIAHEQWRQVVHEMRSAEILSFANGHAIRRLIDYRIQYERASRHVAEYGAVLVAKKPKQGGRSTGGWNPFWSIMRQADEGICRLESELGISPLRRAKAGKVQKRENRKRASDNYLSKTGTV